MRFAEDRRSDASQGISQRSHGRVRGRLSAYLSAQRKTGVELRVGVNVIDQMMPPGPTKVLLEPDALFASAITPDVERCCGSNSRSGVRYRIAAAAGDFP